MLSTAQCEAKFKQIRERIKNIENSENPTLAEYVALNKRLREAYNKEYLTANEREYRKRGY